MSISARLNNCFPAYKAIAAASLTEKICTPAYLYVYVKINPILTLVMNLDCKLILL